MNETLRRDAAVCFEAALAAVEPRRLVEDCLQSLPQASVFVERNAIHLIAVGKAAAAMAHGASTVLGDRLLEGVVIVPDGEQHRVPDCFRVFGGGHPIPTLEGAEGGLAVREMAAGLGAADHLLVLISGGGSALMSLPPDRVTLADVQLVTELLLKTGAPIDELNCVRKHLDELKGGRLARLAAPANVLVLVLSDVLADARGERLDVIASGPLTPDPTTFEEAIAILRRYGVWESTPPPVRAHLTEGRGGRRPESPTADDPSFDRVAVHVVGTNRMAAEAALRSARRRGYESRLLTTTLCGEARDVGRKLARIGIHELDRARDSDTRICVLAAGETTVTVRGSGRGGRNQELALAAAVELEGIEDLVLASIGTDGIDGPTDAAGAFADGSTLGRARELGFDPIRALDTNDSYSLFHALDDLIVTGPTGTNVMDIVFVLMRARRRP